FFFFSSRRRHTRFSRDWSSDVCSSDLPLEPGEVKRRHRQRAADGLPNLDGTPPNERPAILLSPVQAAVEEIFAEHGQEWLPTSVIARALAERGHTITAEQLSVELCGDRSKSKRDWQ